jgi:hypothetical protein
LRGVEQRLRGDELVAIAMHQQHRRPRHHLVFHGIEAAAHRQHQQAGIADKCRDGLRPPQPDVQRHHGALAEADERQRVSTEAAALELGIEERVEPRRGCIDAVPALVRIAERERKPFATHGGLAAWMRRMG